MIAPSQHERERAARRRRAARPALLVALLALLGQALLPHLHALQATSHVPVGAVLAQRIATSNAALAVERAAQPAGPEHAESRCPVCQTLAHAHDLLPSSSQRTTLAAARLPVLEASRAALGCARRATHAPRSPPLPA